MPLVKRCLFIFGGTAPSGPGPPHSRGRATVGRTLLDERSACRRDLYLTTQHSQQTDIHAPVGFEPTILAGERPPTYALDRAATGTGVKRCH